MEGLIMASTEQRSQGDPPVKMSKLAGSRTPNQPLAAGGSGCRPTIAVINTIEQDVGVNDFTVALRGRARPTRQPLPKNVVKVTPKVPDPYVQRVRRSSNHTLI